MNEQRGGDGTFVSVVVMLLLLVLLGGGALIWYWQRTSTLQRSAVVARLKAEQQRRMVETLRAADGIRDGEVEHLQAANEQAGEDEIAAIKAVLSAQQSAWNTGDIDAFMQGYWNTDELSFSSGGTTTRSWRSTLDRYRSKYPDKLAMGSLNFDEVEVQLLGSNAAFVLGKWNLQNKSGGNFTLVFRKFASGWLIVHDHTSVLAGDD